MKTKCTHSDRLASCSVCNGRMHNIGCNSNLNPKIDCCPARHKMLFDQGQNKGINDSSIPMWENSFELYKPKKYWSLK